MCLLNLTLGVVILNFRDYQGTIKCVEGFLKQDIDLHIVVVDNNSPDESFAKLLERFSSQANITILQSGLNGGYAFGNNVGVRYLETNLDIEYIVISNNDVSFDNDSLLSSWYKSHTSLDDVGVSAPVMLVGGKRTPYSSWKLPTLIDDIKSSSIILEKIFGDSKRYRQDKIGDIQSVDCLPGSLFMISISLLRSVGYLDEGTFLYLEECILTFKLKQQKQKVNYLLNDLTYEHYYSKTISSLKTRKQMRDIHFNSLLYYSINYRKDSRISLLILILSFVFGTLVSSLRNLYKDKF